METNHPNKQSLKLLSWQYKYLGQLLNKPNISYEPFGIWLQSESAIESSTIIKKD